MQHLNGEALARLVDEAPDAHEAEHLRDCLACRRELAELRAQTGALGEMGDVQPPAGAWAALEARLAEEALIRPAAPARRPVLSLYRPPLRIAAALALFLLGGAAGAALWGGGAGDGRVAIDSPVAGGVRSAPLVESAAPAALLARPVAPPAVAPAEADERGARLAMNGGAAQAAPPAAVAPRRTAPRRATPADAERAARDLVQAQAEYVVALQRVAAIADPASGNTPETRLAALDQLVELTAQALERVPGDPVINGYHLAALAERDAVRREMDRDATAAWF